MSSVRRETLAGSQSAGGNMASVMSKPWICTVEGTEGRREKESGQILDYLGWYLLVVAVGRKRTQSP
jgi:hypothetical protein